jgi:hypothetical protein
MSLVRPIARRDIKGPALYAPIRDDYRKRIIELKDHRRVSIGDRVDIVFDNRLTLTYQIEEICRLENLVGDDVIEAEVAQANQLMPTEDALAATLFISAQPDDRATMQRLIGLDEHVVLHVDSHAIRATFESGRSSEDRISAVQYLRFPLAADVKVALRAAGTPLALVIDHPAYDYHVACTEQLRASLAADYDP